MQDPLIKYGPDFEKFRDRAFKDYFRDYEEAVKKWPEFKSEFDEIPNDVKEKMKKLYA